jgi:hypothetical protein
VDGRDEPTAVRFKLRRQNASRKSHLRAFGVAANLDHRFSIRGFSIADLRPRPVRLGRSNMAKRKFASRISKFFTSRESEDSFTTVAPEPDSRATSAGMTTQRHVLSLGHS